MKVYLSGPMRHHRDYNFPLFNAVATQLRKKGYTVINPAENFGGDQSRQQHEYMRADIQHILTLKAGEDVIATLPDWEHSDGAKIEVTVARSIGVERRDALDMIASILLPDLSGTESWTLPGAVMHFKRQAG